jgi:class 3 adenylate cyclase
VRSGTTRRKNLGNPDESIPFERGRATMVSLGDLTIGRNVHEPGWRWSTHIRPVVGGDWCRSRHVGVILSGRLGFLMEDGTEFEFGPDDVIDVAPGHDSWVIGNEPVVTLEWSGVRGWLEPLESLNERVLATLVVTDIADSTRIANQLGGSRWNDLLARHYARMREVLAQFRGREVKTTGDEILAVLNARDVRSGARRGWSRWLPGDGVEIRAAVHTGEVEAVENDLQGLAIHEAVRVLAIAQPGEVLVTDVTKSLASGSGARFVDRGEHVLRGLDTPRALFAVASG